MSSDYIAVSKTLAGFAPGDIVTLRSGGPRMTILTVMGDEAECIWFINGEMTKATVPFHALRYLDLIGIVCRWFTSD
ncbi:YodC family protein [Nitrobacter winogradskyi]